MSKCKGHDLFLWWLVCKGLGPIMCQRVKGTIFFPSFSYYTPTKILVTRKSEKKVEELPEIYLTPVKTHRRLSGCK